MGVLRRNEKRKSCGVTDGCTIQITSRMRKGGRHKDKRSKSEKKQATKQERPEQKCDEESKSDEGPVMMHMDETKSTRRTSSACPKEVKEKCNRKCRTIWRTFRRCRG